MGKNIDLDYGDPAIEPFFDATQEMLSTSLPTLRIERLWVEDYDPENPTAYAGLRITAGPGDEQVGLVIEGRYRYITEPVVAQYAGPTAELEIWAVAEDNNFSGPSGDIDLTDYSFQLVFSAGRPSGAPIARRLGYVKFTRLEGGGYTHHLLDSFEQTAGLPAVVRDIATSHFYGAGTHWFTDTEPETDLNGFGVWWHDTQTGNVWKASSAFDTRVSATVPVWQLVSGPLALQADSGATNMTITTGGPKNARCSISVPNGCRYTASVSVPAITQGLGTLPATIYVGVHHQPMSSVTNQLVPMELLTGRFTNHPQATALPATFAQGFASNPVNPTHANAQLGVAIDTSQIITIANAHLQVQVHWRPRTVS